MTGPSRRQALLGGLTLAAAAACSPKTVLADPAEPLPPIDERIAALERRYNADVGLFAVDLDRGRSMAHRGQLMLGQKVFVDPAAIVANTPRTQPRAGADMTLDELCQAALQVSDNTAGNLLLKTIGGPSAITAFARSIGDPSSRLDRWETELNSAVPGDARDTSTPEALGGGYRDLLVGTRSLRRCASSSKTGCGPTRRRACAARCRRGGPVPTRPVAAITAAPTTSASRTVPQVGVCCSR